MALGGVMNDKPRFYRILAFINEMNNGNPQFTPYEIPEEFRTPVPLLGRDEGRIG